MYFVVEVHLLEEVVVNGHVGYIQMSSRHDGDGA